VTPLPEQRLTPLGPGERSSPLLRVIGNNPRVADLFESLTDVFVRNSGLPARDRWLITKRMAFRCGCTYGFGHASGDLDPDLSELAVGPTDDPRLTESDRATLALVDQLYETNMVDDELWSTLASIRSPADLVELVSLTGFYWMASVVANSTGGEQWRTR
jgi:alkylhydroperoxidase family enzyme